jgi:DNA invertase Pin-like site-specific DNA recombinase
VKTSYGRIYGRFSSKPQERGDSKRRQIDGARVCAKQKNIEIIAEPYFDEAVSGKDGANLELEFGRLLREAKSGEVILCEALDRLSRQNPFILGKLIYDLVNRGLALITWQDGREISKDNINSLGTQMEVFVSSATGHQENIRRITRVKESISNALALADNGIQTPTLVKYTPKCFKWNSRTQSIVIDDEKAAVVRKIFNLYISGVGQTSICQQLNDAKIATYLSSQRPAFKKSWLETTVKQMLKNEAYAGVLRIKGHTIKIPSVVSKDVFDKTQLLLQRYANRKGNYSGRVNNLFNGIAVCKHCGGIIDVTMTPSKANPTIITYRYRCNNSRYHYCDHKIRLNAAVVEHLFFLLYFGGSPEQITMDSKQFAVQIDAVNSKINRLNNAIANLYDMAEAGDTEAKDRITARKIEKAEAEQELVLLKGQSVEQEHLPSMMEEVIKMTARGKSVDWTEWNIALMDKLADNNTRLRLRSILPSIFEKVVFDTTARTVEGILRKGVRLPNTMIKEGPIRLPIGEKLEATIGDGKMMLGYKEPPSGKVLVELK